MSDTIEGRIFLLLMDKLQEIVSTLGKLDEEGNVAEDLRIQILGQLSERLTYDKLYREALSDPELRRTKQELESALSNASEARKVVFELFQGLEGFSLEDYKPFENVELGFERIVQFLYFAMTEQGQRVKWLDKKVFTIVAEDGASEPRFTTDRDIARERDDLELMGLDHPLMIEALQHWQGLAPEEVGIAVDDNDGPAVVSWWLIDTQGKNGEHRSFVQPLAVRSDGRRVPVLERKGIELLKRQPGQPTLSARERRELLHETLEPMIQRELQHRGLVPIDGGYSTKLIGWVEITGQQG